MRKDLLMPCGILIIIFSLAFITPSNAATNWGVEADETYEYELKTLKMFGGSDLSSLLKENVSMTIIFTNFNSTGYTYDVYNSTGGVSTSSTNFVSTQVGEDVYTTPVGLPIVLPLEIGTIPDYLLYFGQIVNETTSILVLDDLLANITDFANVTYTDSHSILNENYLSLYFDMYAPEVNASILSGFIDPGDTGGLFIIPSNITNFQLNASIAFNATSGLFKSFTIKIRSLAEQAPGYLEPFDIDVVYGLYVPPPPYTPPPTTPEKTSYPWLISTTIAFVILGTVLARRRKRNR